MELLDHVNGTLIWYYYICPREVWLMARQMTPDEDDPNIVYGRFLQEHAYQREKKEISLGNIKIDILKKQDGQLVVGEVKKSSRYERSARMQLLYYLWQLREKGIDAKGELLFPEERKRVEVELNEGSLQELEGACRQILAVANARTPPPPKKIPFCRNCAYRELKKSIFVFTNGKFQRKDNTLYFETTNGRKFLPVEDVKEIYVFGEVDVSKKFLELCSQKEIILHYFNHYGYYTGTFYPREHLNSGYMTVSQVEHYIDKAKRLELARRFVNGAVRNIVQVLRYYGNRGKAVHEVRQHIEDLSKGLDRAEEISQLMAIEGNIREQYYNAFDTILNNEEFRFVSRSKRPPRNELNTLISFGNSVLYTIVLSEIYKTHLDPRIGYLHTTNFRRFPLNLDVAEIFKPILIDRLIFTLVGRRMLTAKDFEREMGGVAKYGKLC